MATNESQDYRIPDLYPIFKLKVAQLSKRQWRVLETGSVSLVVPVKANISASKLEANRGSQLLIWHRPVLMRFANLLPHKGPFHRAPDSSQPVTLSRQW